MLELICKPVICYWLLTYNPDITIDEGIFRVFQVNGEIVDELGDDFPDGRIR